jgi:hypothetical protein
MKDTVPVEPSAELSLDNVLTNIRFRGEFGYKLKDYTLSPDRTSVELEFEPCVKEAPKKSRS